MKRNFRDNHLLKRLLSPADRAAGNLQTEVLDLLNIDELGIILDFAAHGATSVVTLQLQTATDAAFTTPVNEGSAVALDQAVEDLTDNLRLLDIDVSLLNNRYMRFDVTVANANSLFGMQAVGITNRERPVTQPTDTKSSVLISNDTV